MTQCDTAVEACTIDACGAFVKEFCCMLNFYKSLKVNVGPATASASVAKCVYQW